MSEWFETLDGLQERVWARLAMAALQSDVVSFASATIDGAPTVRSVVLRAAEPEPGALEIYTDIESSKIAGLRKTPLASVLLWDPDMSFQIRAACTVEIHTGEAVAAKWDAVPDHSRLSYGITPPPGQPISDSTAYAKVPDQAVFAVMHCLVDEIDAVHLGRPHRRARFTRSSSNNGDWAGNWLAP